MSRHSIKENRDLKLPDHYQELTKKEVEIFMASLGPYKKISLEEMRKNLSKKLGKRKISDVVKEIRNEEY